MSGKGQEKLPMLPSKRKTKNSVARDQAAQAQPQVSRDTTLKTTSTSRKPSETPVKPAAAARAPQPVVEELYVPENNFNVAEIESLLKAGIVEGGEFYKPDKPIAKPAGAWAAKPSTMLNGKDFWDELNKQVAEVQASRGIAKTESNKQGG